MLVVTYMLVSAEGRRLFLSWLQRVACESRLHFHFNVRWVKSRLFSGPCGSRHIPSVSQSVKSGPGYLQKPFCVKNCDPLSAGDVHLARTSPRLSIPQRQKPSLRRPFSDLSSLPLSTPLLLRQAAAGKPLDITQETSAI